MLEVIGAGLGRTGSYSLKTALTRLGLGPCHHMSSLGEDRGLIDRWESVVRGEQVPWQEVLAGYRSAVDWPVCAYWRELADAHPAAKVILTVRDPDRWYTSVRQTIYRSSRPAPPTVEGLLMWLEDRLDRDLRRRRRISRAVIWDGAFGGRFDDRDHALAVFARHNAEVRARIPAERLLVFDSTQGWGPLCAFLGVPEPDEPFPRLNQAAEFQAGLSRRRQLILTRRTLLGGAGRDAVR